ncbi:MAG: hypothetical protein AB1894_09060 [Chloroflexota bacterium]
MAKWTGWLKGLLYLAGVGMAAAGCFLPWMYWAVGDVVRFTRSLAGIEVNPGGRPLVEDHGGVLLLALCAGCLGAAVWGHLRPARLARWTAMGCAAALLLAAAAQAVNIQGTIQEIYERTPPMALGGAWPGEGLWWLAAGAAAMVMAEIIPREKKMGA